MKKLVAIVTAVLFIFGFTANAQMMGQKGNRDQKQGMMMQKDRMMQGMMGQQKCPMCGQMMNQDMPMRKFMMMVNHLPAMQQQLSLTDNQVEELIDLQTEFKKEQIDYKAELRKKQMKMKSLLEENASANQVKNQMEACSETKINMKVAAYETVGKMKNVLTENQKEKLKDNMMQKGMMQGGMMKRQQGGMMQNRNNN